MQVQEGMQDMLARQIAERCAQETGAGRMSKHSEEVALIAIAHANPDMKAWRRTIRSEFRARHPEYGSVLLMILLPLIINLVSAWLARWIFNEHPTSLDHMRMEAISALKS
jgi:hypothetical protein